MKDGQLLQVDQPQEILRHPANKYVKDFFKGSLGNDLYETPLRQAALFNEFKQKEAATLASMTKVKADEKLAKVLAILSEQEEVAVQNENGAFLGFVDRQWLVAYLNGINKLN